MSPSPDIYSVAPLPDTADQESCRRLPHSDQSGSAWAPKYSPAVAAWRIALLSRRRLPEPAPQTPPAKDQPPPPPSQLAALPPAHRVEVHPAARPFAPAAAPL